MNNRTQINTLDKGAAYVAIGTGNGAQYATSMINITDADPVVKIHALVARDCFFNIINHKKASPTTK